MVARSCVNLVDLVTGDFLNFPQTARALPRVMTVPGIMSDVDGKQSNDDDLNSFASEQRHRMIIVSNFLPLNAEKDETSGRWCFTYDEDSIFWQLKDGLCADTDVVYVGSLKVNVHESEQEEVSLQLLKEFSCVPTFIPSDIQKQFYDGFCKQYLWPLLHSMLPMYPGSCELFDRSLWQAYVSANRIFADKVMEVINPEVDYVWIHDYHLMVLPTILRRRHSRVKLGFFLHSPFPSSEIYRSLPVRSEILKALLNTDLIGFHTFDYARHFLSCCRRILDLEYENKKGYLGIEYFGRTVFIKILPAGIHMGRIESALSHPSCSMKVLEICRELEGRKLIIGVDDMDVFKGVSLKFLAIEKLLKEYPELRGEIVLVQILNPPNSASKDAEEVMEEANITAEMINEKYGFPGYAPIVIIDHHVPFYEKAAYYTLAECCIVNAVRDGMNLIPYQYIVCRQGSAKTDEALEISYDSPRRSALVVSEFIGCSPSLSGAIRVNPWDINDVAEALRSAIMMYDKEKKFRHEKHYKYVSSHDVAYWARHFEQDLVFSCKDHYAKCFWGLGFGLNFRVLALSPSFRKLCTHQIGSAYKRADCRAIFLDYDGTIVPQASIVKAPSPEVVSVLNNLCSDPNNTVFIVSGRGKTSLGEWLDQCENLGIAAEHGYFTRWGKESSWEMSHADTDFTWKRIAEPVMRSYTEATDGSYIETKESALVWHYYDAAPDFGSWQARELLDHLENVLANEPVVVKKGQHIVEVKPQGITKGLVVQQVLSRLTTMKGKSPDFILCIGDDRSDEDMFESILTKSDSATSSSAPEIFACTVGQKPSKARYYLDDTMDVMALLTALGSESRSSTEAPSEKANFCVERTV
ncbi:probable alpha,alpha-trehalose-phosphate synthase [UDP-forming] 9 [Lotus japonicus]|uniref:probable alpha,alpha-trehalose-phosphate synthase [UDP-forming] 9 n=1 Tax=Lotus japonicus TaxID=34305 RepID=UPI0025853A1A|nr:probable alpha,alpha-trehalose-phosphate synthase [UDP-forming] 9 [Lotus japonicus]XP_057442984.1 probable alpha,alpha-trehalose-phosphate synthase [UDP-forming] 9 [Lotus japonicus]